MATLVLAAAGAALGGAAGAAAGGALGGVGAVAGRALGGVLGGLIDQRLLGGGSAAVEGPRLTAIRVMGSREGAPIPRVHGRMRLGGQVIWASRFRETASTAGGGKGRPAVRSYRYSVSLAVALCEGPVDRIGRIWADGKPLPRDAAVVRLHRGDETQAPDALVAAVEGADRAPAWRGVAYLMVEDLDLSLFGDRVPQFSVEVFRTPRADPRLSPEIAPPLADLVEAVALSPGSGEFALDVRPVRRRLGPGRSEPENVNSADGRADALVALDQLEEEAPACRAVSLVVSWFGDDLRCGVCRIRPMAEEADKITEPVAWEAGGLGRAEAALVGRRDGRPVYGGTPSDRGVVDLIREMTGRGLAVMFYPFILMDVAPGSGLPDPYGGTEQAAYPWRGRITLDRAPGRPWSPDGSADAADQVAAFFGAARADQFLRDGDRVRYVGPDDWGLRRFILHYAHLCAAAGGVSAFCIGSEMRGLTTIRSAPGRYPAVLALKQLAADVRAILGPAVKIGYAADWSEYFGHQPGDGSGDAVFHLDPLWADAAIDFVGIDNYMPLSDWRDGPDHLDAAAGSICSLPYLQAGVEGGEGFDWFYASAEDRSAQRRTPIRDGAHGEDWIFRFKDIRSWWSQPHHDRIGGVRRATPTPWVPQGKPIWFTELGCGAVDKGANQPNVFVDPKSSESALPYFSTGAPDPQMQRRYLQATLDYWRSATRNPVSAVYGGAMVETARSFVWTWDLRPWPDFPLRREVWADGGNHALGHWITGRLGDAGLAETVAEICAEAGVADPDVSDLHGAFAGYAQEQTQTGRQALQPLMIAFGFDAVETGGRLRFVRRGAAAAASLSSASMLAPVGPGEPTLKRVREPALESPRSVRFGHVDAGAAYEPAVAEALGGGGRSEAVEAPLALTGEAAQAVAERMLAEAGAAAESFAFRLPPSAAALEVGDVVSLSVAPGPVLARIDRIADAAGRRVEARRVGPAPRAEPSNGGTPRKAPPLPRRDPLEVWALDLPTAEGLSLLAFAEPWPGPAVVHRIEPDGLLEPVGRIERPATLGVLAQALPASEPFRWTGGAGITVRLHGGALASRSEAAVLQGANLAAVETEEGWEVLQFAEAALVAPGTYALRRLLRGQVGTEWACARTIPAGARFALLDGAALIAPVSDDLPGAAVRLRVGPAHLPVDDPAQVTLEAAANGAWLRPHAPARLRAARRADGAVAASWVRRTRIGGDAWGPVEPPLGEESERYRVTVAQAGALLRSVDVTTPAFVYDRDAQIADGASAPFEIAVAQLSARIGAGSPARIVIHE